MLNHHTHKTDPIRDKKTNAFDTSMASPSRQHSFTVRVSHRCSSLLQSVGAPAIDQVCASRRAVPWVVVLVYPSLGAPAIEFGHSRRVWLLLNGDDLYE